MFGKLVKLLLVLSALAPVALVYAWVAFSSGFIWWSLGLTAACAILSMVCFAILKDAHTFLERFPFDAASVDVADRENTAFLLLYLSPLFTSKLDAINIELVVPTIAIFALMTATGYNYHFNPLLGLLGWHFYKVTSREGVTYVLITRKQLRKTGEIKTVGQLTEYILIDLGGDNAS